MSSLNFSFHSCCSHKSRLCIIMNQIHSTENENDHEPTPEKHRKWCKKQSRKSSSLGNVDCNLANKECQGHMSTLFTRLCHPKYFLWEGFESFAYFVNERLKHIFWRNFISVSYLFNLGSRALQHNKVSTHTLFSKLENEG